jgi:hypothetical protein
MQIRRTRHLAVRDTGSEAWKIPESKIESPHFRVSMRVSREAANGHTGMYALGR